MLSAGVGAVAAVPLFARILFPRLAARLDRRLSAYVQTPPATRLKLERKDATPGPENGHQGFAVAEMAASGERLLRDIGLTSGFARLVFILGHGSDSLNNPHKSAYDCGACGGSPGAPNGRALAHMLNDPRVRERMAANGVVVPADTWFVGGYHNTCDDTVTLADVDAVPPTHAADLARAEADFARTCERNAHERCRRFMSARLDQSNEDAGRHVYGRSVDLAQARPELGHATNAICVVGRRTRTRGLYLDRRAFLTSYDPTQDDAVGFTLARLLGAAVPVCGGINLEYYFSHVDSRGYGCGTKLPHNITGLVGVMDGAQSDLRTGLPWQMVEIHEPVRLLFIVETTPAVILGIMDRNATIGQMVPQRVGADDGTGARLGGRPGVPARHLPAVHAASRDVADRRHVGRLVPRLAGPPGVRRGRPRRRPGGPLTMPDEQLVLYTAVTAVVAIPAALVAVLGLAALVGWTLTERAVARSVYVATTGGLLAALWVFGHMLATGSRHVELALGEWVHIGHPGADPHYHFAVKLVFDRLSVPLAALALALCGVIGAFAQRYMHREPGYNRFFVLYALFLLGMVTAALAGTIETLFLGWELVGLSSALLVGFFDDRPAPVRNGLRVWVVYRISDAALLLAAVVLHHATGEGDFDQVFGTVSWPGRANQPDDHPGVAGRRVAGGGGGGQIRPGAVLRLAAAGDGGADAEQCGVLRGAVGSPGGVFAAAVQSAVGRQPGVVRRRTRAGTDDGPVRRPGRAGADRHQVGAGVRVARPGGADRGRDRPRLAVHPARSPDGSRAAADAAIRACPDVTPRPGRVGKRLGRTAEADGRAGRRRPRRVGLPVRRRTRLLGRPFGGLHRPAGTGPVPPV